MNILHVIDSLSLGGAERLLVSVINNLPDQTHHVICLADKTDLAPRLPANCQLLTLGFKSKTDTYRCVKRIRSYIREHKIEVVHSHLIMANIVARLATPRYVKLFNSLHSLNGKRVFNKGLGWQRIIERITYKKWHHIIGVSAEVIKDYDESIGLKGPSTVLHNFVDDRFFAPQPHLRKDSSRLRLIAVGQLKAVKNYPFLVEVFRGLPAAITLDIYGDGPDKSQLEEQIKKASVSINLCGSRQDIENAYASYDLYIMPSLFEGHPVALMEAMAAGMPAIVSDIPVMHEATAGKGLFFSLADPAECRNMILSIFNGDINLDEYATYNHQYASKTARKEQYIQRLLQLYQS